MLRKIRITAAILFFALITLLFLDFTGTLHGWFGWMVKIQLLPAVLSLNVGVVVALVLLTLVFGRVYCSVICPLGVLQDVFSWMGGKAKKGRFTYSPALTWLRYIVLALFVIAMAAGLTAIAALIAPYSSFGRIAANLFAPVYQMGNNVLAYFAERMDSYAFYSVDVWVKSASAFALAALTFVILFVLAWRNGRTYCNTICPAGTILGFLSKYAWLKPVIDTSKCNGCGLCARNCKASCIHSKEHKIDYSRCVACMDCIDKCKRGAIKYVHKLTPSASQTDAKVDANRRSFLTVSTLFATSALLKAQEKKVDGGLAKIEKRILPERAVRLVPPGSQSIRNMARHCTTCQLCVSVCPNGVLRPSSDLKNFMQPEMSYERGWCRPECTKCSEVCPAGAIRLIDRAQKSSIQIGHAVWVADNCVVNTKGEKCGNCARHCPTQAIQMVPKDANDPKSLQIPVVNTERCIGCGACEYLCPSRPFSAIYVEGHERHREI